MHDNLILCYKGLNAVTYGIFFQASQSAHYISWPVITISWYPCLALSVAQHKVEFPGIPRNSLISHCANNYMNFHII